MGPSIVGLISVVCISIGLLVGLFLQNILPARHLDAASKDGEDRGRDAGHSYRSSTRFAG